MVKPNSAEIIKELTALKDTTEVSSEKVLILVQRVETPREQRAVLDNIRDAKDFDSIEGIDKHQVRIGNKKRM